MSADERPAIYSSDQIDVIVPGLVCNARLRKAAQKCGLIREFDGAWLVGSRSLLQLIADTVAMGVPASRALEIATTMADAASTVATTATMQFIDEIWTPFVEAGSPDADRVRIESFLRSKPRNGSTNNIATTVNSNRSSTRCSPPPH